MAFMIERIEDRWDRVCYQLTIDQPYIDKLNNWIDGRIEGEHPEITIEDIKDLYNLGNEKLETKVSVISHWYNGEEKEKHLYEESLEDLVRDYLNDDLWDSNYEIIDSETNDVEDTFYEC